MPLLRCTALLLLVGTTGAHAQVPVATAINAAARTLRVVVEEQLSDDARELLGQLGVSPRDLLREEQKVQNAAPPGAYDAPPRTVPRGKAPVDVDTLPPGALDNAPVYGPDGRVTGSVKHVETGLNGVTDYFDVLYNGMNAPVSRPDGRVPFDGEAGSRSDQSGSAAVAPEQVLVVQGDSPGSFEIHTNLTDQNLAAQAIPVALEAVPAAPVVPAPSIVEKVQSDLATTGTSDRLFTASPQLSTGEQRDIIARLDAQGVQIQEVAPAAMAAPPALCPADQVCPPMPRPVAPTTRRPVVPVYSISEDTSSGATCPEPRAGWPPDGLAGVLAFNGKVLDVLGLGEPRRQKVLVVDTGFSASLVGNAQFAPFLYRSTAEALLTPITTRNSNPRWRDTDESGYYLDEFSAAFDTRSGRPDTINPENLDRAAFQQLTYMIEPKPGADDDGYIPYHGSYVAGLAVGGPQLISGIGDLSRYVGVQAFRLTTRSDSASASVVYDGEEIKFAMDYAARTRPDVVNVSLRSEDPQAYKLGDSPAWGGALLVVAAGNDPVDLDTVIDGYNPATITSLKKHMIVVAALDGTRQALWDQSSRSSAIVDIAAPGVDVASFDDRAGTICMSGTSAAAPLVAFTSALVGSFTGAKPNLVRARVLGSAKRDLALEPFVAEGRVLDAVAAADVFVDRVYVQGDAAPKRGWILQVADDPRFSEIVACNLASGDPRTFDLDTVWSIFRDGSKVEVWEQSAEGPEVQVPAACDARTDGIEFFDLATNEVGPVEWSQISRIVPTPFRARVDVLLAKARAGALRVE